MGISIHWFRNDLRVQDNPALSQLSVLGLPIVGLYILEDEEIRAQNVWLHASLKALEASLKELKIPLVYAKGSSVKVWKDLLKHHSIRQVSWNESYEPQGIKRDQQVEKLLLSHKAHVIKTNGTLLLDPAAFTTGSGDFYKVFTPYWKMHQKIYEAPERCAKVKANKTSPKIHLVELNDLQLMKGALISLCDEWEPGEKGAHKRLKIFAAHSLSHYQKERDFPAKKGHSGLSPHLHFGEISPHIVVKECQSESFIRELVFRDFAAQLLFHLPHLADQPMKPQFSQWKWCNNHSYFDAWKKGKTGYPIVDAGMREMYETGFMHNRVRMIVASFLVKDLNVAWQKGADWFLKRLIDADLANNSFNWQWSAGTGPDAQPFFRIFNPVLQSRKFDANGDYIKKWVPELAGVSPKTIHAPWEDPMSLESAGVNLGKDYPFPLVDHDIAKKAALKEFHRVA